MTGQKQGEKNISLPHWHTSDQIDSWTPLMKKERNTRRLNKG